MSDKSLPHEYRGWNDTCVYEGEGPACGQPRAAHEPVTVADHCPKCGGPLEYDEVDIGVGTLRGNPGCPDCHWTPSDDEAHPPAPPAPPPDFNDLARRLASDPEYRAESEITIPPEPAAPPPPKTPDRLLDKADALVDTWASTAVDLSDKNLNALAAAIRAEFEALALEEKQRIKEILHDMILVSRPTLDFHRECCEQTLREVLRRLEAKP